MSHSIIIDIDGTLANIDHRLHFIKRESPDWDQFYGRCNYDIPNKWCVDLVNSFHHKYVILVSGRRKDTQRATRAWLKTHGVRYDELVLVRQNGDHSPDHELKRKWLKDRFGEDASSRILFVVDDREGVVDMWRGEGLVKEKPITDS